MTPAVRLALSSALLLVGCGKKSADRDECVEAADVYEPTASEVPLPDDYTAAAEKRIGVDNYRRELVRVARELAANESQPHPAGAEDEHP